MLGHNLTIEVNARDSCGPVERQGDMLVVARNEHTTQAIGGGESAILKEQRTGTTRSHQPQGQIGHTGMLGADTHLHIGHRTTIIDLHRSHGAGDVRQRDRRSLDGPRELGRQVAFTVDGDVETQIHARRVVEEDEVSARLQRRNVAHGNADDAGPLQGGHPIVDVQIVRVRKGFAADVHFERQVGRDHVGHLNNQATGIRRHDAQAEIIATRSETDVLENPLIEGRQHLRLDLKLHGSQGAGTAENVVLQEVVPGTGAAETRKVEEGGARTIRRLAAAEANARNVIIETRDRTRDKGVACSVIADGAPVVDGHAVARVDKRPLKVEEVVVEERLGEGDVPGDAGRTGAEITDDAGRIRSTIRNDPATDGRHEEAVPIGPQDMEGLVAASNHQFELTGLLILSLHTDVVDLAIGGRIGDLDALFEPLQRRPVRRGQRGGLKIGQTGIGGHVEVQIGSEQTIPQTIAGTTRSAGARQIGRRSDDEFDVLAIGQARGRCRLGIEEVGEDEEMPLRGLPRRATDQRRLRTHTRCRNRDAIGGHDRDGLRLNRTKAARGVGDVFRCGDHVVFASGIGRKRHHEILHDVGAILEMLHLTGSNGIHIHPTGHHVDDVLAGQRGLEHHAFHVVHRVIHRIGHTRLHDLDRVGARPAGRVAVAAQIIADEDLSGDRVGDHQIQVVDQLQTGGGIARRIRPDEGEMEGSRGGHLIGGELQSQRLARPGGEFAGKTGQFNDRSVGAGQPDATVEGPRQAGLSPSRVVHHRAKIGRIKRGRGAGAVDEQRLVGRRCNVLWQADTGPLPEFLDLGQHAGNGRGCHAGARQEPVPRGHRTVQIFKEGILHRIGVVLILQLPLGRARGKDLGTRGDDVGLEAAVAAFDANAHIAATGEVGHLGVSVGGGAQHEIGGQLGIGARLAELLAAGPDHAAFIVGHHGVGEVPLALQGTHGDDVLGVARHGDRPAQTADTVVAALSGIARGKNEDHRLLAGDLRQCVPRGRVIAGRNGIVFAGRGVAPAVVGNQRVGHRRLFLQEGVRNGRAGLKIDGQDEQLGVGRVSAKQGIGHRTLSRSFDAQRTGPAAGDGPGHVGSVAIAVDQKIGLGTDRKHPVGGEVGMGPVDARVVDVHHDIAAGEPLVRGRVGEVGGAAQKVGGPVVEQLAAISLLDEVHLGRLGQGHQRIRRHIHRDECAERAALTGHLTDSEGFEPREGLGIRQGEHEAITRIERTAIHHPSQQLRLQLEGRMPWGNRGHIGIEGQSLERLVRTLHQEGIDGQVRNHLQLLLLQPTTRLGVRLVGELHNMETGFRPGNQRLRQGQRIPCAGIDERIAQHQRPRVGPQLVHRLGGVAGAPRELRILRGGTLTGIQRADAQPLGGHMGRHGHGATQGRDGVGGRRSQPGGRRTKVHGRRLYPAVQPQGTHRQGDGNDQASRRAHDENGITAFSPWSARGGLPPPSARFG